MASLSPIFTETVIGFLFFGGGVSGVLLPLALLLLLVTLVLSYAVPSLNLLEAAFFADDESVVGFLLFGDGVSGVLLPLPLLLLLVTLLKLLISVVGPSLLFLELASFDVDSFLLLGAGVFSMEEDAFFIEESFCLALPL